MSTFTQGIAMLRAVLVASILLFAGCGLENVFKPTPASIQVTPGIEFMDVGGTSTLTATVRDKNNKTINNPDVEWTHTCDGLATVSPQGANHVRLNAIKSGNCTVTAKAGDGSVTVSITIF